ncbi:MAG: DUF5666 domain-containing protein [Betaproteobacteria bacterium]|nr:DUF5666 domain-containing protein [Betaproteobacteria bacterium]
MISRVLSQFAAVILIAGLVGCGSGGAGIGLASGIGSGGTGIVAGTITGFGSVIVDGSRYPDAGAAYDLTGDSENAVAVSPTSARLGQQIEAEIDSRGNATAVHIYPEVIGVVSEISASTNTITVAGTRVVANAANPTLPLTVYGGYAQFSSIQLNDRVEVDGLPKTDGSGPYVAATRIELKPSACAGGCAVRVTGTLSQLNSISRTFTLGGLTVSYGTSTAITPSGQSLADGERVSVYSGTPLSGNNMAAAAIAIRKPGSGLSSVLSDLRLSGEIRNYTSNASFSIAGVTVNAGSATLTPAGLVLANELNVIVRGNYDRATNQLAATSVTQYDSDSIQAEVNGTVTDLVSPANFRVRGVLVDASAATFSGGTAADLQNNAYVEIQGTVANNVVRASSVEFATESEGSVGDLLGVVSGYTSPTGAFSITLDDGGATVQAILAPTPFYIGGTSADLRNGKYITANASLVNGQWVVNTVTFMLGIPQANSGSGSNATGDTNQIDGIASNVDLTNGTFNLDGITVYFAGVTPSGNGTLANGVSVQVTGTLNGSTLTASLIRLN